MKSAFTLSILLLGLVILSKGQENEDQSSSVPVWTEEDREYLLDNLIRSKIELAEETSGLTNEQWNFKENPDRWSINQIVEHLAIYELIFINEISVALQIGELPQITKYAPDSLFISQDPEGLKRKATTDFTKPFTYTVPLGNNEGKNNLTWFLKMRNESTEFIKGETSNLRIYYINFGPNIHQKYLQAFTHVDRHLRQIRRVKTHPNYPGL
ncbi:MAG: DinB family protein [Bacteroidota bacterium]